mgnify:CR=1 FL=1
MGFIASSFVLSAADIEPAAIVVAARAGIDRAWVLAEFTLPMTNASQAREVARQLRKGEAVYPRLAEMQLVDYKMNHNSYSVGGNYRITTNLAAFARVSDGVAFNADRILFGTPLDGSAPININTVKQIEGGVKWRSGSVSTFVTLFQAKTDESNYEATT